MIKKINYIKNFGVFNSYRRTENIQDFAKVNILYGWNYSGKTTISRILQCFESKELNKHYLESEFEIEDYDGNKGNHKNLNINNYKIKVFNTDFVEGNIHLEGERFNPILLLGEDTKKAQDQINHKNKKVQRVENIITNINSRYKSIHKNKEEALTQRASSVKETLQIVGAFTKHHFKTILRNVRNEREDFIKTEEEVSSLLGKATASESEKLPDIFEYEITFKFSEKIDEAKKLLTEVPEFSDTIQYFIDNPQIANWIEKGLPLHEDKEKCEFCGNSLSKSRIEELTSHFSRDLKIHKRNISLLIDSIKVSKIEKPTHQKSDIYKEFWPEYEQKRSSLNKSIDSYNQQLEKLIELLETKKKKPFEKSFQAKSIENVTETVKTDLTSFNRVIEKNRDKTKKFDEIKSNSIKTLKKHFVAKFIEEFNLVEKEKKIELYKSRENNLSTYKAEIQNKIDEIEAEISKAHKGKEKLNEFIQKFLGRKEIEVVVEKEGDNERFRLKRNDAKAVNLSEGEKTAIAFSFFLTKLLEYENLKNTIVYIDDPISSLDSNHIFQLNAILKNFFFSKESPESINPKILNCKQLFLSTHNFDFFNLLRELPKPKDSNKFYYYINRIDETESSLDRLPKALNNYKSEYHYLFKKIYDFNEKDNKDISSAIILPNILRRFVELYTYSRIPGDKNQTVDHRTERLWGMEKSKRILKVCHYFSHGNGIGRMKKHNEFICDIGNAVSDLIGLVSKNDKLHFEELKKAIN